MNLEFFRPVLENNEISNFMKICALGTELLHGDGQTDRHDETNGRFSFAKVVREMQMLLLCAPCHQGMASLLVTNGGYNLQTGGYSINGIEKATEGGSSGWGSVRA
jgi:hypothetical protein